MILSKAQNYDGQKRFIFVRVTFTIFISSLIFFNPQKVLFYQYTSWLHFTVKVDIVDIVSESLTGSFNSKELNLCVYLNQYDNSARML